LARVVVEDVFLYRDYLLKAQLRQIYRVDCD
jgi:hypothetical protein